MKKLLMITMFLATTLALAACGGGAGEDYGQSEQAPPPEPTQAGSEAPENGDAPEETASEDAGSTNGDGGESSAEDAPSGGPSATTIQGEEVALGGDDVTALFFMAGW